MANEQHIEWLCEGVEAWNARRKMDDFTPDFSETTDLAARLIEAGIFAVTQIDGEKHAVLEGVDLFRADLREVGLEGAYLMKADLRATDLSEAILVEAYMTEADLGLAELRRAKLGNAILDKANLILANFYEADISGAEFRHAKLDGATLCGAEFFAASFRGARFSALALSELELEREDFSDSSMLRLADVRSAGIRSDGDEGRTIVPTNLTKANDLTQDQLNQMIGDRWTRIPDHLERPAHWLREDQHSATEPHLPESPAQQKVGLNKDLRLSIEAASSALNRCDLEALYKDLRDSVADLRQSGGLGNLSPLLSKGCDRFFGQLPEGFADLDDVRFAVGAETLRIRVEAERGTLMREAPEKIGHLDAVLYTADLIKARLPGWIAFLQEEADVKPIFEARTEEAVSMLEDAAEGLARDPERFDTGLFERIREYLDSKTMEGFLAAKDLLVAIAHKTFLLVSNITRDVLSDARKIAIKGIAGALLAQLGGALLKLAGMLPKELDWIVRWIEYLPKVV